MAELPESRVHHKQTIFKRDQEKSEPFAKAYVNQWQIFQQQEKGDILLRDENSSIGNVRFLELFVIVILKKKGSS
jgi:hypothetical protein